MNVKKGWNYSLLYLDLFFRWSRDKDKLEMMIFIIYTNFLSILCLLGLIYSHKWNYTGKVFWWFWVTQLEKLIVSEGKYAERLIFDCLFGL